MKSSHLYPRRIATSPLIAAASGLPAIGMATATAPTRAELLEPHCSLCAAIVRVLEPVILASRTGFASNKLKTSEEVKERHW